MQGKIEKSFDFFSITKLINSIPSLTTFCFLTTMYPLALKNGLAVIDACVTILPSFILLSSSSQIVLAIPCP